MSDEVFEEMSLYVVAAHALPLAALGAAALMTLTHSSPAAPRSCSARCLARSTVTVSAGQAAMCKRTTTHVLNDPRTLFSDGESALVVKRWFHRADDDATGCTFVEWDPNWTPEDNTRYANNFIEVRAETFNECECEFYIGVKVCQGKQLNKDGVLDEKKEFGRFESNHNYESSSGILFLFSVSATSFNQL